MTLPDAVVFDFDGLILDTESTTYDSVSAVFAAHGQELSQELWAGFIGTTDHPHWTDILEAQLGERFDRDLWVQRRLDDGWERARALDLLPGVAELIGALTLAGVPMAVASSSQAFWVEAHLRERELFDSFVAVCTGDEVPRGKPDPGVYLLACGRLGVDPARTVALEDSVHGVTAARAAGMVAVAVPGRFTRHMDYEAADLRVDSLAEVTPEVLGALVDVGPVPDGLPAAVDS